MALDSERSGRFGDFLREHASLPLETLEAAIAHQREHGGRLGTCLLEIGAVGLEDLARLLAEFHAVPLAPAEWLEEPDKRALRVLPLSVVRYAHVLPMKLENDCIHLAMMDPSDERLINELEVTSLRDVKPYLLPEVRLFYWLEVHLGIDRPPRFVNLAAQARKRLADDAIAHTPGAAEPAAADAVTPEPAPPEPDKNELSASELTGGIASETDEDAEPRVEEILLDVTVEDVSNYGEPVATPKRALNPHELAELEAALEGAGTRDGAIDAALALSHHFAEAVGLLFVQRGRIHGFRARGGGISQAIRTFDVPVSPNQHSVITLPAKSHNPFRGCPPPDGLDREIVASLGREGSQEILVHPIRLGGRVLNLLYADNGLAPLGDVQVAALRQICIGLAHAYERILLKAARG